MKKCLKFKLKSNNLAVTVGIFVFLSQSINFFIILLKISNEISSSSFSSISLMRDLSWFSLTESVFNEVLISLNEMAPLPVLSIIWKAFCKDSYDVNFSAFTAAYVNQANFILPLPSIFNCLKISSASLSSIGFPKCFSQLCIISYFESKLSLSRSNSWKIFLR